MNFSEDTIPQKPEHVQDFQENPEDLNLYPSSQKHLYEEEIRTLRKDKKLANIA